MLWISLSSIGLDASHRVGLVPYGWRRGLWSTVISSIFFFSSVGRMTLESAEKKTEEQKLIFLFFFFIIIWAKVPIEKKKISRKRGGRFLLYYYYSWYSCLFYLFSLKKTLESIFIYLFSWCCRRQYGRVGSYNLANFICTLMPVQYTVYIE